MSKVLAICVMWWCAADFRLVGRCRIRRVCNVLLLIRLFCMLRLAIAGIAFKIQLKKREKLSACDSSFGNIMAVKSVEHIR